jgi:tellurite resistance protein TehA-like permease
MTTTSSSGLPAAGDAEGSAVAELFPGYFALVMATGIVAIASRLQGLELVAEVLFVIATVGFVVLVVLNVIRLVRYTRRFFDDLTHHATAFTFLTVVAGANVLGTAAAVIHGWWDLSWVLWVFSLVMWVVLVYTALSGVILREPKADLGRGINGTWFLLVVATQSVAVLGSRLLTVSGPSPSLELLCMSAFTLGIVLYLILMTLVFLRWTFMPLDPHEMQPPAWIAMGAVAITCLAGANLLGARSDATLLAPMAPFIEAMTILAWATATFWTPLMIVIGVWRHVVKRVPLVYHPSLWAMVFPIGMYSVCTARMAEETGFTELTGVAEVALVVALVAWAATFTGLLLSLVPKSVLGAPRDTAG